MVSSTNRNARCDRRIDRRQLCDGQRSMDDVDLCVTLITDRLCVQHVAHDAARCELSRSDSRQLILVSILVAIYCTNIEMQYCANIRSILDQQLGMLA